MSSTQTPGPVATAMPGAPRPDSPMQADLVASIVVFLVALPLCLGIALASGAPLVSGIIAGIIGGIVVGPLSGSQVMVSGPAAGLTAVVLSAIATLGSFESFLAAVVLAGLMQILLGVARAGLIGMFFPTAVIQGMLAAIGLILILKQIPHAVGFDADAMGDMSFSYADGNTFSALIDMFGAVHPVAIGLGILSVTLACLWGRVPPALRRIPAGLVIVILAVVINLAIAAVAPEQALSTDRLVQVPTGEQGGLLAALRFPDFAALGSGAVWTVALTLALVASLETLLSLEATDKLDPQKRSSPPNRELLAQGVGNTLAGLIGGLPITGVIVRSAANISAGGRTRRSAIMHGFLLLGTVMLIPTILNLIPLAALAGILIHVGYLLARPALFRNAWARGRDHFAPFAVTVVAILFTDLLTGIIIGLAVGVFFVLRQHATAPPLIRINPDHAVVGRYALADQTTFLSRAGLQRFLDTIAPGTRVEIDGRTCRRMDPDIVALLHDFRREAAERQIDYRLVGIPSPAAALSSH